MKKSSGNFYNSMLLYIHNLKKRDRYMIIVNSEKLFQKLNEIWGNRPCPMCGNNQWTVSEDIYTPTLLSESGAIELGNKMLPLIPVSCTRCGNTVFVNGKILGCVEETNITKDGKVDAK